MVAERRLLYIGYAALILLPNGDLINYLVKGTPLVIWKQLLAILMTVLAVSVFNRLRCTSPVNSAVNYERLISSMLFMLMILSVASIIQGVSIYRLFYALFAYAGFLSSMVMVQSVIMQRRVFHFFRLLTLLGLLCSIGLIYDYFFSTFDFLPRTGDISLEEALEFGYLRRASFLFGASTTIFPFLSMTLIAAFTTYFNDKNRLQKILAVVTILIVPLGILVTGSRAQVILAILLLLGTYLGSMWYTQHSKQKVLLILVFLIGAYFTASYFTNLTQSAMLSERYSLAFDSKVEGNDMRYRNWKAGYDLMCSPPSLETFVGIGLGRSMGMVNDGDINSPHYESSFFQAFSEGGLLGLLVRFLPAIMAIMVLLPKVFHGSFLAYILLLWLVLYCASVSASPTAAAYHTQLSYFIIVAIAFEFGRIESLLKGLDSRR